MRFSIDTRESHGEAIIHIAKYLKETRDKEITMNPKIDKSFEAYVDASFSGEQIKESAAHNPGTAKRRSGYIVMLHGCPLIWYSKLQTQVTLSTTDI